MIFRGIPAPNAENEKQIGIEGCSKLMVFRGGGRASKIFVISVVVVVLRMRSMKKLLPHPFPRIKKDQPLTSTLSVSNLVVH